jgi:hypothetical protein
MGLRTPLNHDARMAIDRHKLHFGLYRTPRFKYAAKAECEARGEGIPLADPARRS